MRLFTAICFDDETKNALFSAVNAARELSSGNFSRKENLHLTLVFIGETDRRAEIEKAISEIEFPSFRLSFEGAGTFEKGILWAGISENEKLKNLFGAVSEKLSELGIESENREFVPHITLARKFRPEKDFSPEKIAEQLPEEEIIVNRISLMKSEREEGVLRYTEIFAKELF